MQDAVTFNSGLFIPVPKKGESTNQKIAPLCSVTNTAACSFVQDEYEDLEYIVFDELSMMNGTQIGNISDRLREVKHPYRGELCSYFGGYNVVCISDWPKNEWKYRNNCSIFFGRTWIWEDMDNTNIY